MTKEKPSNVLLLWRVQCGRISANPVKVIDLGGGEIKVVASYMMRQKRDDRNESYHDTHEEAVRRLIANAERDAFDAKMNFQRAQKRLAAARKKWSNEP